MSLMGNFPLLLWKHDFENSSEALVFLEKLIQGSELYYTPNMLCLDVSWGSVVLDRLSPKAFAFQEIKHHAMPATTSCHEGRN